jgi:ribokinase
VVGSINVDQVVRVTRHPLPGETLLGTSITLLPGGKGANQAVAAARLGASVSIIGAVGRGDTESLATELLRQANVDLSAIFEADGPTGLALICVADDGENTIVVIPGANAAMSAHAVMKASAEISNAAVVVLQGEIPADGIEAAADLARGRLVLNLAPVIPLPHTVIRAADPLVINEHEGAMVLAQLGFARAAPADDSELVAALRAQGIASVVLTRGSRGAICSDSCGTFLVPAPPVQVVDSSGAGDAFVGALSTRLATGSSLLEATNFAVRVGAFAVQTQGTQPSYPHQADVLPQAVP